MLTGNFGIVLVAVGDQLRHAGEQHSKLRNSLDALLRRR